MTATDDRPSIAELSRVVANGGALVYTTASALLEIAAAALALRAIEKDAARKRFRISNQAVHSWGPPNEADYAAIDVADQETRRTRVAYEAALAKVRP